ncbi:MAG: DUF2341 domain-containing protein [Candidatus Thorarchaeota archaeon]|nr:DUF2341 domain-containing protein [Candidatus Thorarchaeota archaeon]
MRDSSGLTISNKRGVCCGSSLISMRRMGARATKLIVVGLLVLLLCPMTGLPAANGEGERISQIEQNPDIQRFAQAGDTTYAATGASQTATLKGVFTNDTQDLVMMDSSAATPVSIYAPQGWTGTSLSGTLEHLSTQFAPIQNGLLDLYHTERTIIAGSSWNAQEYNVPDSWTIVEEGETIIHPYYGRLFFHSYSGSGREGSMGWRFNANFGTTNAVNPGMELYLRQHVGVPYRELYSAKISINYYVRSVSTMNDYFYLFIRLGDYESKLHLFTSGTTTDQWLKYTVEVPMSAWASYPVPGALDLDIGIGSDYSGLPSTAIDNQLYVDEVDLTLEARPLPEQIGLSANYTAITGSVSGSVSPYVPDGSSRDCRSRSSTGISTSTYLEVGVIGTAWSNAVKYQVGIQFPLNIPQGAVITYAAIEVEALFRNGFTSGALRVFVAQEDDVAPFTSGLPALENRYSWGKAGVAWILDSWEETLRYRSPDLSPLVQSVVSRSGWDGGNYVCIMIDYLNSADYSDTIEMDGSWSSSGDDLPTLHVDYVVPQAEDNISIFQYKKDLTIDHTKVSSNLENFPVLVDIYDTDLKTDAQPDGDDIRFMIGSETLDYEIEVFNPNYNSTHAHLTAWVSVPELSSSVDTIIGMYYGSETASRTEDPANVWGNVYESVWHFSESSGNGSYVEDSSGHAHDGLPWSTTFWQSGVINSARRFQDASENYMTVIEGDELFDGWADWQFSFWLYPDFDSDTEWEAGVNEPRVFYKSNSLTMARVFNWGGPTGVIQVDIHFEGSSTEYWQVEITNRAWNYIVMKYQSSDNGRLYGYSFVNGAIATSSNTLVGIGDRLPYDDSPFALGYPSSVIKGMMDEFRTIKEGYTSLAWIETEYTNQYDPASFLSVGTEQSVEYGASATLLFTTNAPSVVSFLPRMTLNISTQKSTLDADMQPGTSFIVGNGTAVTWIANVLVSPPPGVAEINLTLEKPSIWTFQNVVDSVGLIRTSEVATTATQVIIPSSVLDVYGVWSFNFTSSNEATNLECAGGLLPYDMTTVVQPGESIDFRGTASIIPGSAMKLTLVEPGGLVFYESDNLFQDGSGRFEWADIGVDASWPRGTWTANVDFNDTGSVFPLRVGRYSREFIVRHGSFLQLQSPGDAVGDQLSVKTAGDLLLVEVYLSDSSTLEGVSGSSVAMNWTVSGAPTEIQLEDYGDGSYGKAVNTSDLGLPGMWRINIQSSHQYLADSFTYFDLELSHPTHIIYTTPKPTAYGDDFSVRISLYDAINGNPYPSALIASNGSLVGAAVDYGNGTYLVQIEAAGLEPGTYCFEITATPTQSFVLGSSTNVVFTYVRIRTQLVQIGVSPISVPWGRTANATLMWLDLDHGEAGIAGGLLTGDTIFQYTDLLDGTYSIRFDVSDYDVGLYLFNITIAGTHCTSDQITISVRVIPHRTAILATYDSSVPLGGNTSVSLIFYDLDLANTQISGNFSFVLAQWSGGSSSFGSKQFWLDTDDWALGAYTLNLTLYSIASPRYYYDARTAIIVRIAKLTVDFSWDPIDTFPVGDDFGITLHLTINESESLYNGGSIDGLDGSYFAAENEEGIPYTIGITPLGGGLYLLTVDKAYFSVDTYFIRIFVAFGATEDYRNTQTPIISFAYTQARSELSSPDFPAVTISYNTNATITIEFLDIDRAIGIDAATILVNGSSPLSQILIGSGRYRVILHSSDWSIGLYVVNITASAEDYESKSIWIEIRVRQIRTYATASVGMLDIPVGDVRVFYVDYVDLDHNIAVSPAFGSCNWTLEHYNIVWTGIRWKVTITTFDTDTLGSYVLRFTFSGNPEYEMANFSVSLVIRTIHTELRLVTPASPTPASGEVQITVYYGDRDHGIGIASPFVLCTVRNATGVLTITLTSLAPDGYYLIRIDPSQFGRLGTQQLTISFNWTGSIQKYENKIVLTIAEIIGEDSELILYHATPATACLGYMDYTFIYLNSFGSGITNSTFDVYISVEFVGLDVSLALIDIWEVDRSNFPGYYSVGFNNTILGRTGLFSMRVFINWSQDAWPYYTNRTDLISVRVLPRDTLLSVVPPTSVAFAENATFSFTFEDITGGTSNPVEYSSSMNIAMNLADFSWYYNALDCVFTISFNTSQFGAPIGERLFTLSVTWSGIPFYANKTGHVISVTITSRQTALTYPTPPSTPYGDNVTFTVVLTDVAGASSYGVDSASIALYSGATAIPLQFLSVTGLGQGRYFIELDTSYFAAPGNYELGVLITPDAFYYQSRSSLRTLAVTYRETILTATPPGRIAYNSSLRIVLEYLDLNTLDPIVNGTGPNVDITIINGTGWIFTCQWQPSTQSYLVVVETYNQILEIGKPYLLWLNFSTDYLAPFYTWADVLVSFQLRERDTSLNLISTPLPTPFLDFANFTVEYKDVISYSGINGASLLVYFGGDLLSESADYYLVPIGLGQYAISIDTSVLGTPGIKAITVVANWPSGTPYYSDATRIVSFTVTQRPTNIEIVVPPSRTQFLNNITFEFAFRDIATGQSIGIVPDEVRIYSEGSLLSSTDYSITIIGLSLRVSLNSTIISASLVAGWNITVAVVWTGAAPYYADDQAALFIDTVSRAGTVELEQVLDTPLGDNITLSLAFIDQALGVGIEGASIALSCLECPGLVENADYWVTEGIGAQAGIYSVEISSSALLGTGSYHFVLEVRWNPTIAPFYRNVTNLNVQSYVRAIQVSLSSELPTPSVAAFYQDISFAITFTDIDHSEAITGAEGSISLRYGSTGFEPAIWSVYVISDGVYGVTINLSDNLAIGLQYIIVNITLSPYQSVETQTVFGVRNRIGGISADLPSANYAGEPTHVTVYLTDEDSGGTPLSGATLAFSWSDMTSYVDLGDGRYNVTLYTSNLGHGVQSCTIYATLAHFSISPLNLEIELLAVTSELIVVFTGPRPDSPLEIYWGEQVTIYAALNDTLRGQLVVLATINYVWSFGTGVFELTAVPGNYTGVLDTGLADEPGTVAVTIEAWAPNYLNASAQVSFQLLPRLMEVIPDEGSYVFSVSWGGQASVVVLLSDSIDGFLVPGANLTASWDFADLTLNELPGQQGYYALSFSIANASFGTYEIQIYAFKENYRNASVTLIMSVSQIHMVVWLDDTTASYEYTPIYWSEVVRIGVYVLTPSLNPSDPFATGLSNCILTWFSPEMGRNGTLINGTLIGGRGYYYFDFNTSQSTASVHTFRIAVTPPSADYTDAENATTILVQNLPAIIQSAGSQELVWGWAGYLTFTFFDTFHGTGIEADLASFQWAGESGEAEYFDEGLYGVPFDTQQVRPGTYRLTIIFRKDNYNDVQLTISVSITPVPTEIVLSLPAEYELGDTWSQIEVPYGESLTMVFMYNNTWSGSGVAGASFANSFFSGPGFFEAPLSLTEQSGGNYSLVFEASNWALYSEFTFTIVLLLENHTTSTLEFVLTIVEIPTVIEIQGQALLSLSYGNETTFWIVYSDDWHIDQGVPGATVIVTNQGPEYATVEYVGEDASRPGWYQFRVVAFGRAGFAEITIQFNKTYYAAASVHLTVSISPSEADIAMQNMITYGSAFAIILLLSSIVWVRIIKVPKLVRAISAQIRQLRRGKIPKPAEGVRTRQEITAELFGELSAELRLSKKAEMMPAEAISIAVPEINILLLDLAILTSMSQEEVDDFRRDLSKMKLSQQVNFVAEVIKQEVVRIARQEKKSIEQVLEEVRLKRQERIGGEAEPITLPGFDIAEEEAALFGPAEVPESLDEQLTEKEIQDMRKALLERGLPLHEVDAVVGQARKLPREVAETLLKGFGHAVDMHEPDKEIARLSDMEIEMLRVQLHDEGASPNEINTILEQAREVPRALAMELLKGFRHEREAKKAPKPVETMTEDELTALRGRLFLKGTPEDEIESIIEQAKKVPRELAAEFLKEVEQQEPVPEELVEFEDRLSKMELEDLREELMKRNLPPEEVESILAQAKNLPSALVKDLLDSIDAEEK